MNARIYHLRLTIDALLAFAFAGCAVSAEGQKTEAGGQKSNLRPPTFARSGIQSAIRNPKMSFMFAYSPPLTNCFLQSSTDMIHWTTREDFWVTTNAAGTTYWNLRADPSNPREFYRIKGEAVE
jgi:hypothetical protein